MTRCRRLLSSQHYSGHHGFSLLELLVVMAIAGLMLALIPPLFSNALTNTEMRAVTRDLATALRSARTAALTKQQEQVFTLNVARRFYQYRDDRQQALPRAFRFTLTTAQSERVNSHTSHIRFYPDGSSSGGYIAIEDNGRRHTIAIDWLTGRVTTDS